jgi:hypothetical protein
MGDLALRLSRIERSVKGYLSRASQKEAAEAACSCSGNRLLGLQRPKNHVASRGNPRRLEQTAARRLRGPTLSERVLLSSMVIPRGELF